MSSTLRVGLIGCGVIGTTHAEAIASLPDAQLVAVADTGPANAQRLANTYGARAYTNLQEMVAREELDIVTICTPSGYHRDYAYTDRLAHRMETEDVAVALLRFKNGALSSNSHALQIADMMRAIREGGIPLVDGHAARHPVEIILGIYESARTHMEVTFP